MRTSSGSIVLRRNHVLAALVLALLLFCVAPVVQTLFVLAHPKKRRAEEVSASIVGPFTPCRHLPMTKCNVQKEVPVSHIDMPPLWLPVVPGDSWRDPQDANCMISDAYRFIFVKNAKTAGTTIGPGFLRRAICPPRPGEVPRSSIFGNATAFSASCTAYEFEPRDGDYLSCSTIPRWKWAGYFVFAAIRDPTERAISAYSYCGKAAAGVPFSTWCENPNAGGGRCRREGAPDGSPNVHWAVQTATLCRRWPCVRRTGIADAAGDGHSPDAVAGACSIASVSCIVDAVVRLESLAEDMAVVIENINAVRDPAYPPLPAFSAVGAPRLNSRLGAQMRRRAEIQAILGAPENAHCAQRLAAWFEADYELLGYPRP